MAPHLVEGLIGAAAIRVDDLRPPAAGDGQHAVAFGVLDDEARQQVRDTRAVARHADAELAGEPRVRAGHMGRAGLVARRHDLDAELVQVRIEAEIRAVDDAEDFLDTLGLQHACKHFTAAGFTHGLVTSPQ